jgi:hypothetical protein
MTEQKFTQKEMDTFVYLCEAIRTCALPQAALLLNEIIISHPICCSNQEVLQGIEVVGQSIQLILGKCSEQEEIERIKTKIFDLLVAETNSNKIAYTALLNIFMQVLKNTPTTKGIFMSDMEHAWDFHAKK